MTYQPYIEAVIEREKDHHTGEVCRATVDQARDEAIRLERSGRNLDLALETFLSEIRENDFAFNDNPAKPSKADLMEAVLGLLDLTPEARKITEGDA